MAKKRLITVFVAAQHCRCSGSLRLIHSTSVCFHIFISFSIHVLVRGFLMVPPKLHAWLCAFVCPAHFYFLPLWALYRSRFEYCDTFCDATRYRLCEQLRPLQLCSCSSWNDTTCSWFFFPQANACFPSISVVSFSAPSLRLSSFVQMWTRMWYRLKRVALPDHDRISNRNKCAWCSCYAIVSAQKYLLTSRCIRKYNLSMYTALERMSARDEGESQRRSGACDESRIYQPVIIWMSPSLVFSHSCIDSIWRYSTALLPFSCCGGRP